MPEVIARPESAPDSNPIARYYKPDECPHPNVPAHCRYHLVELYPVLMWCAIPRALEALVINVRPHVATATCFLESGSRPLPTGCGHASQAAKSRNSGAVGLRQF